MKKLYLILVLICLGSEAFSQTSTFNYTGAYQTYSVPPGVTSVGVDMHGGCGGFAYVNSGTLPVSLGGRVQCTMNVTPGSNLYVYVGGAGQNWTSGTTLGGWNGGGSTGDFCAGGGGATDIRTATSGSYASIVLTVAGGGGGGGDFSESGGAGGGTTGASGTGGACGGAQTAPACTTGYTQGTQGVGGGVNEYSVGGGGGGWWGGNQGVYLDGGGGGGSSYPATTGSVVTGIIHTQGYAGANGNGQCVITVLCASGGTITGGLGVCQGSTTTLSNSGVTGTWYSSNTAIATVSAGVVTAVTTGTVTIIDSVNNVCGGLSARAIVTVNPIPGSITGTLLGCPGATNSTLACLPTGGSWTSSNSTIANISSSTGVVSDGTSTGTASISYSLPDGCPAATAIYTVNPNPAAISGSASMCGGTLPTSITLTDGTSGGSWSSGNTSLATVGATSGIVSGVATGNPTISYTLSTGCYATTTVTVNQVAPISGSLSICFGTTSCMTDATGGGTWSSSNTGVATVNSSGCVTSVSVGSAIITYSVPSVGCSALQTVNISPSSPTVFAVTGGGSYCSGGSGLHVGLNGSNSSVTYYLFNGATLEGTATGTGSAIDFGLETVSGSYTVVANYGTTCATNMSGSVAISINSLPTAFSVEGGGGYCSGGSGESIILNSSTIGVNYQLMIGGTTPVGTAMLGTGGTLTWSGITTAGVYTVVATNSTTGCTSVMSGSAVISINALPTAYAVTGGGGYCSGGSGVSIGLGNSASGTTYQLVLSGVPVGSVFSGTGGAISFGTVSTTGTYSVLATNSTTGCTNTMSGTATVSINSLPTAFTVTGGGSYCLGGIGVPVGLNGSASGVNYQLYEGLLPQGSPTGGTGASLNFGNQTLAGSYTVIATNTSTGCVANMTSSVLVSINPLPSSFLMTGGGGYCAGGSGVTVGLSGSVLSTTYYLYDGATLAGAAAGTGAALSFGTELAAGIYTATATISGTGCAGNMNGFVTVTINPLPTAFTVSGGGAYCAGGTGRAIGLGGSATGINYQLYNGSTIVGSTVAGNGSAITFGSQTLAGSYTVIASNATTGCPNNMLGSALITINPLPTVYAMTGGGGYCTGGLGVNIGLANSNSGISYQLTNSGVPVGGLVSGTGAALNFGLMTATGTYSVTAANTATGCATTMGGSEVITINALPTAYPVTNGGAYCAGGAGVPVGLGNSVSGTNYQLFNGVTPVGGVVAGTGSAISFGLQTASGTYTAVATNATTGCSAGMTGSVNITVNPLPTVYAVTGGGAYCAGGSGSAVGLSNSASGINYTLMDGGATAGTMAGTGSSISFGSERTAGTYTVIATNSTTGCSSNMSGSVPVSINPVPGLYTITGGGNYCAGGTGVNVGISGSATGISYQLIAGISPAGAPLTGSGFALNFGPQTAGSYSVLATNTTTGCSVTMTGTTSITANPLPILHSVTGGGNFCAGSAGVPVGLDNSNTGTNYQLYNGLTVTGPVVPGSTGLPLNFGNETGAGIYTVMAINTSTGCSTLMTGSATVGVNPLPTVYNITGGGSYCSGSAGVHIGLSGSGTGIMYQLMNGTAPVGAAQPGSGSSIDFGPQLTAGSYTIVARGIATACVSNMNGSAIVSVNALPPVNNVTGGGDYCAGGPGVAVGLDGSYAGMNYQLYNGGVAVGSPVAGSGSALSFGLQTAGGNYTIIATNAGTACTNNMNGTANVNIDPLPNTYTVLGGGTYCTGGTGVDIVLGSSDAGTTYQLYEGITLIGSSIAGTGSSIDFGNQTSSGTYTVVATNSATTCSGNMSNSVNVSTASLPSAFIVSGGGNYCAGGTGVDVMLNGSATGVSYQLWVSGSPIGSPVSGTGSTINFGDQITAGTYSVIATAGTSACNNTMTGTATIGISPLPAVFTLSSAGSNYCAGGSGIDVSLSGSATGVTYQLYNGVSPVGAHMNGTGAHIDFGNQTGGGGYTVVATNGAGCSVNMGGFVNISVEPLPNAYSVTGGGSFCMGGTGVNVGISGSQINVTYQLFEGVTPLGTITGTSGPINFGAQTGAGTYTVVATNNLTTCSGTMTGTAAIAVNLLPAVYAVSGGGTYCAGGTGLPVGLGNSSLAVNYQLYIGGTTLVGGPVSGTGTPLSFGDQMAAGTYTVVATDAITGCSNDMGANATIAVNAAPAPFAVNGGGGFCTGGTGVVVGVNNSAAGVNYGLFNGLTSEGTVPGSGSPISFGLQSTPGVYTVVATNTSTGCSAQMPGTATVVVNVTPSVYAVVGGGSYCAGGAGVHVGVGNSASGINYTLMNGTSTVATIGGRSGPLDFGLQTAAGIYTVHAVNAITGCAVNMSGSVTVSVNPVVSPSVTIAVSGGSDTVCAGNPITFTANILNGGSSPSYQWSVNGVIAASSSTYIYIPINGDAVNVSFTSSAMCASPTSASASVSMSVLPVENPTVGVSVNPGTEVCSGTSVTFTASPSFGGTAPVYAWFVNASNTGSGGSTYTYSPANGDHVYATLTSNYQCRLSNTAASGTVDMTVDVEQTPVVSVASNVGLNVAQGQSVTFTATYNNAGANPTFQWSVNSIPVPGATTASYTTSNLADGDQVACEVTSSGACAAMTGSSSVTVHVIGTGVAQVSTSGGNIMVVPNPNKGLFTVKGTLGTVNDEDVSLQVTDMLGNVIYTSKVAVHGGEINEKVNTGTVANGMYILTLHSDSTNEVFHMVIEQ